MIINNMSLELIHYELIWELEEELGELYEKLEELKNKKKDEIEKMKKEKKKIGGDEAQKIQKQTAQPSFESSNSIFYFNICLEEFEGEEFENLLIDETKICRKLYNAYFFNNFKYIELKYQALLQHPRRNSISRILLTHFSPFEKPKEGSWEET